MRVVAFRGIRWVVLPLFDRRITPRAGINKASSFESDRISYFLRVLNLRVVV